MLNFLTTVSEYATYVVILAFIGLLTYFIMKMNYVNTNLKILLQTFKTINKDELTVKFKLLDQKLSANPYISVIWTEFKSTLFFPENSLTTRDDSNPNFFEAAVQPTLAVQTTIDPEYFFNEETLVLSKYNSKLVSIIPTILTGLGPLFTFLAIATAFANVNFTSQEETIGTVSGIMHSMQMAALVSVSALSASILFMLIEKITYELRCKSVLNLLQDTITKLFDNTSSEKFLVELLRQNRVQSANMAYALNNIPEQFKKTVNDAMNATLMPYLESIVFGLNKIQEYSKEMAKDKDERDMNDDLF